LVYFTPRAAKAALEGLARALAPGGFLVLGPMDALEAPSALVEPFGKAELQVYRRTTREKTKRRRPLPSAGTRRFARSATTASDARPTAQESVAVHFEALRAIEAHDDAGALSRLEALARRGASYIPGIVERALLSARLGRRADAEALMCEVLRATD